MDPSVSTGENPDSNENNPQDSESESNNSRSDALGKTLSTMLATVIKDLDSKAQNTLNSKDKLNSTSDRLTRGKFFFLFNLIMVSLWTVLTTVKRCLQALHIWKNFGLTRINPGQPIWPVTRSLDRVNHRVGFQNYG